MTAPPSQPHEPPIDPALAAMIEKPQLLVDPVFPPAGYLEVFGRAVFQQLLTEGQRSDALDRIRTTASTPQMVTFVAAPYGFWAIDLDVSSDRGVLGRSVFVDRVRDSIRRPPPQLAAVACEQHILARGVARIQISDGAKLAGGCAQVCSLRTVG